ncbi:MAG: hypothetical protein NZN45_00520 [Rhodovarius sp.]|nr:hypothetical protein [Rhodovarius sp.]
MTQLRTLKSSFAAGELAPELLGRADLRAYANGARRLRNVFIQPTGGITRRPGLRHLAMLPGPTRLIPFEFNTEQTYLLALSHQRLQVFLADALAAELPAPWSEEMLPQLAYTQSADTLLIAHPDLAPLAITRSGHTSWTIGGWNWSEVPTHRFAPPEVTLTPSATTGTITLTASAPVFEEGHVGARWRVAGKRVDIAARLSPTQAIAQVLDPLPSTEPTRDWEEGAISSVRGWPVSICFHQDRLVIGGTRDLPNRLFLSRSGDLFNFDTGQGLDDEAISFGLVSDQVNAIRAVFSGRHLQVFTSGGEWMVSGDPLTPASIQLTRQTRVGSPVKRMIQPVDVDGSTIFVARHGRAVHEFAYTDVQQIYQAHDLAMLASHLVREPVAMAYDQRARLLHVAMEDGSLATLTLFRAEQVTAWTAQHTEGAFRSLAELDGTVYAVVERWGTHRLERFDPALYLDAALEGEAAAPQDEWSGLEHLEGRMVGILADGAPQQDQRVAEGRIRLPEGARRVQAGLRFTHVIEPLPPELLTGIGTRAAPIRLVSATFRLLETADFAVDLGRGPEQVPFRRLDTALLDAPPIRFSGDVRLRALGWRRDAMQPLWRIEGHAPLPMTLLSVTTEMRMTD